MLKSCLCVVLLCLASYSYANELVPLLAWSNSDALSDIQSQSDMVKILPQIKVNDFKVAVLMKSPSLSFDDIAKFGGVYGEKNAPLSSLQTFLSTSRSSFSTGVSGSPTRAILTDLAFEMGTQPQYIVDVSELSKLDGGSQQLIVVELPEGEDEDTFRQHDVTISKVVSSLSSSELPYAIFYTGDHASSPTHFLHQDPALVRRADDSFSAEDKNITDKRICYTVTDKTFTKDNCTSGNTTITCPCLLFCINVDVNFTSTANQTQKFHGITNTSDAFTITGGSCYTTAQANDIYPVGVNYSYISMNVEFKELNNASQVVKTMNKTMKFGFTGGECVNRSNITQPDCGFWTMNVFVGDDESSLMEHKQFHTERIFSKLQVPFTSQNTTTLSYACGNSTLNRFIGRLDDSNDTYNFTGMQVQPFASLKPTTEGDKVFYHFGSAYNCQGYLGSGSYMGVAAVLILLLILYISSVFIFSIQTIDRFDDARGETIKVENLH